MDLMGELVISVAMVTRSPDLSGLPLPNFEKAANQLAKNTDELQEIITSVRMLPVSSTFHKMHRIVRDLSHKTGKQVELQIVGEETEVDKTIIENLSDPLMHILRNSVDHGLEASPEARIAAGKKPMGLIKLEARNAGSDVIINISDDGKGLNRDAIAAKAVRNGLVSQAAVEVMPDKEIYQFIMLPGFSTNDTVTELSGRGVGMDVVNKNIESINGTVILDSEPGKGLMVTIKIPSSLAILAGMEVAVGNARYIIPTLSIKESQKPQPEQIITDPDGNEMFLLRGEVFPITRLHSVFNVYDAVTDFTLGIMLTCEDEGRTVCLFVDELIGEQQVVQKPIPQFITQRIGAIQGVSGCTILGNGAINLIVNPKDFL
jgi:two-component system chemotaxis sensor kinase CheA